MPCLTGVIRFPDIAEQIQLLIHNPDIVKMNLKKTTWEYPAWGGAAAYDLNAPNMYKDREPRFYVSVFFGGNKWHHGSGMTLISFC